MLSCTRKADRSPLPSWLFLPLLLRRPLLLTRAALLLPAAARDGPAPLLPVGELLLHSTRAESSSRCLAVPPYSCCSMRA